MSSKNYKANGYGHNLNLPTILTFANLYTKICIDFVFHILREVGAERNSIHLRHVCLTRDLKQLPFYLAHLS